MKKKVFSLLVIACLLILCYGCKNAKEDTLLEDYKRPEVVSDSLYVNKVDNLDDDFALGMDASTVLALEASGVKYYDFDGTEKDVFQILSDNGINYIRVRVWNDPFDKDSNGYGGGNCTIDTALEIGKRANKYGMKLCVDFHYSDFWADPAKQMAPKAWKGLDYLEEMAPALYEYTKECLTTLKNEKIAVGMVQIGNETNRYLCGTKVWANICALLSAGSKAVREVYPKALVAVHFANPEKVTNYPDYAYRLNYYNVDYDVFGSSYYPYWHGTLENLSEVLSGVAKDYNKKVMVLETSYAFTSKDTDFSGNTISDGGAFVKAYPFTIQGQANSVRDVVDTIKNKTTNGCGVFYWEGTWISVGTSSFEENSAKWEKYGSGWAASYATEYDPNDAGKYYGGCAVDNQAFFDEHGHVLESLKVFSLMKKGNVVSLSVDATEENTYILDFGANISLPSKINAVMNDDSKQEVDVTWDSLCLVNEDTSVTEISKLDTEELINAAINYMKTHGVAKYKLVGKAGTLDAICYISMVEFNYLTNYSFEEDANQTFIPKGWTVNKIKNSNELWVEDKSTDSKTGKNHYHFWAEGTNNVEFELEQKVENLNAGKYKYSISIMGGDGGTTNIYAYVKINGEIVKKAAGYITEYNKWMTMTISPFEYNGTDEIIVGIYVQCDGAGNGAWGKIDDALLNAYIE